MSGNVIHRIRELWRGHDDFEEGGFEYVAFVISKDIEDMEESEWDRETCLNELADICINAIRKMDEEDGSSVVRMLDRLDNHEEKGTDNLVEKYQGLFEEERDGQ